MSGSTAAIDMVTAGWWREYWMAERMLVQCYWRGIEKLLDFKY